MNYFTNGAPYPPAKSVSVVPSFCLSSVFHFLFRYFFYQIKSKEKINRNQTYAQVSKAYRTDHKIIIMKNFTRRSSHGHHGSKSKRRELTCSTHTHVDRTHSLTHLHQHSYNHTHAYIYAHIHWHNFYMSMFLSTYFAVLYFSAELDCSHL